MAVQRSEVHSHELGGFLCVCLCACCSTAIGLTASVSCLSHENDNLPEPEMFEATVRVSADMHSVIKSCGSILAFRDLVRHQDPT